MPRIRYLTLVFTLRRVYAIKYMYGNTTNRMLLHQTYIAIHMQLLSGSLNNQVTCIYYELLQKDLLSVNKL